MFPVDFCYTKEDVCIYSNATVENVTSCPKNATAFKERSEKKKCYVYPHCQSKQLVYHCTRYDDGLADVCAPKNKITGKCCTFFEKELGKVVEDNTKNCSECPFQYISNESFKYSECVEPAMSIPTTETTVTPNMFSNQTTIRTNETTEMTSSSSSSTAKQQEKHWTLIVLTIIVGVVAFFIMIVFLCIKLNKRNREHYLSCIQRSM